MKLAEAIAAVPKSLLTIGRGEDRHPNWPGIFEDAVARMLAERGIKFDRPTLTAIAQNVNISSFQRCAAQAAADHINGVVRAKPKAAKAPKGDPINGGLKKRGADPITGKTKAELKAEAKEAARAEQAAAKAAKLAAKEALEKAKAEKAAAKVAKKSLVKADKPAKKSAAPKVETDPITGEPVTA